jgi:hypothetical protein
MGDEEDKQEYFLWDILFGKRRRGILKDIARRAREEIKESYLKEEACKEKN